MNKRGAETTIGTIVILILAVLVLAVVIMGFSMGWNNLWNKLSPFFNPGQSVDATIAKCESNCLAQQKYVFCCERKNVILDATTPDVTTPATCDDLRTTYNIAITCDTIKSADCIDIQNTDPCKKY